MIKKISIITGTVLVIVIAVTLWKKSPKNAKDQVQWRKNAVEFGVLEQNVSATGTLGAVGTVEVGSQVSGIIDKILVDYNDIVKSNQPLAILDKTALLASRDESRASLARAQAQAQKSQFDLDRAQQFFAQNVISEVELQTAQSTHAVNQAQVDQARASLRRAEASLTYTTIRSPINGTVISRAVERGQTVAASLSTPTLFVVAEDLAQMEILADVDESDIGKIQLGQEARFTVQAYPDREFNGTVQQVRLQPQVVQNVVNYTVVLSAPNPELALFPGMTATVDFIIAQSDSGIIIPTAATNFRPPFSPDGKPRSGGKFSPRGEFSAGDEFKALRGAPGKTRSELRRSVGRSRVWVERQGQLKPIAVKLGLSDDTRTALLDPGELQTADSVVVGSLQNNSRGGAGRSFNPMMMGGPRRR